MPSIINHDDKTGLEVALRIRDQTGGSVTAVCMGPPQADVALREALAMGCDEAVLVSGREFGGSDTYATAAILGAALKKPVGVEPANGSDLYHKGFVMLARKNAGLSANRKNVFEIMRDKFYPVDGQIIYSMWDGYLKPEHGDQHLIDFIGGRPIEHLHVVVEPQWAFCDCFIENCARFSASGDFSDLSKECFDGAFGLLDDGLEEAIPPIYQHLSCVQNGVLAAKKSDRWGLVSSFGYEELPFQWDWATFVKNCFVAEERRRGESRYTMFL